MYAGVVPLEADQQMVMYCSISVEITAQAA